MIVGRRQRTEVQSPAGASSGDVATAAFAHGHGILQNVAPVGQATESSEYQE
jgi:hypothetical protein